MRKTTLRAIEKRIKRNMGEAERYILRTRQSSSDIRKAKPRNEDKQKVLDILCRKKWQQAVREGKIKKLGDREYYYDIKG